MAVGALLLASLVGSGNARAQSAKTLVSNIDQLSSLDASVGDVRVPSRYTQRFTTGRNANGYDLLSVSVRVIEAQASAGESVTAYIYRVAPNGVLGALIYTLETPSPLDPFSRVNEFSAPSGATLYPNTEYALAFTGTGDSRHDVRIMLTSSPDEDSGSESDWEIEDEYYFNGQGVSSFGTQYAIMMNVEGRVRADPVPNTPAVGTVTISGGQRAGIRATASVHSVADAVDELGSLAYTYQWVRVDGGVETDIPGAADEVYRLESADVGNRVRVKVFFQDTRGNDEELVSAPYPSNQPVRGSANADLESLSVDGVEELYVTKDGSIYVSLSGITSATESVTLRFALAQADATCEVKYSQDDLQNNAALSLATELLGSAACTGTDEQALNVALAPGDNHVAVLVRAAAGNRKRFLVALYREEEPDYVLEEAGQTRQGVRYSFPEAQPGATVRIVLSGEAEVESDYVLYRLEGSTAIRLTGPNYTVPVLSGGFVDLAAEAVDDEVEEGDEVFMVTLRWDGPAQPLQGSGVGGRSTSTEYTIVDNDFPVDVSFGTGPYEADEGGGAVAVTVKLSEDPLRTLTIPITVSGRNGAGSEDYALSSTSVTFFSGQTRAVLPVVIVLDDIDDSHESVALSFGTLPSVVTPVEPSTAVVTIDDDDDRGVTVSETELMVEEGESKSYTLKLESEPTGPVIVNVNVPSTHMNVITTIPSSLTFTASDWRIEQTVTVSVADDEKVGMDENVMLEHEVSGGDYGMSENKTLTVSVRAGYDEKTERAWLARFGRTIGPQVAEAVSERLEMSSADRAGGMLPKLDAQAILSGSSFVMPLSGEGHREWTVWGRGAYMDFDGEESVLEMDGEVLTGTVGMDIKSGHWLAGLAVSHSEGDGRAHSTNLDYGEMDISLTGVHPYLQVQLSDRLSAWGMVGYGEGDLDRERGGESLEASLEMRMGVVGLRGLLMVSQGWELALKSEALAVTLETDGEEDYQEVEADASRVRLLLEGVGYQELESGGMLEPHAEIGARYDGGDAEEGMGVELGVGLRYAGSQLRVEGSARGLLEHEESDYGEWGVSGAVVLLPGHAGRGLSFRLDSSHGATASKTDMLWSRRNVADFARDQDRTGARLEAEIGYGMNAADGRGLLTPYAGFWGQDGESAWRLGSRLEAGDLLKFDLVGAVHRRQNLANERAVELRMSGRW